MDDVAAPTELLRALAVFAEPPDAEHERLTRVLGLPTAPAASDYADLFLFQLYPYASVHLGPEGMMGGEARDVIAGFWRALGYDPPAEPDHLAALLGLYAGLLEHEAASGADSNGHPSADSGGDALAERTLLAQGRRALLAEHIAPWVFAYLNRVTELDPRIYGPWAEVLADALRFEVERAAGGGLPIHLRSARPVADPRVTSTSDFLAALLAPARSGMILTRADLARFGGQLDLGLRAGERRYALEHLLAQDAEAVLESLAEEARRQGAAHRAREGWLGESAAFFATRAEETAVLLESLAADPNVESPAADTDVTDRVGEAETRAPVGAPEP